MVLVSNFTPYGKLLKNKTFSRYKYYKQTLHTAYTSFSRLLPLVRTRSSTTSVGIHMPCLANMYVTTVQNFFINRRLFSHIVYDAFMRLRVLCVLSCYRVFLAFAVLV